MDMSPFFLATLSNYPFNISTYTSHDLFTAGFRVQREWYCQLLEVNDEHIRCPNCRLSLKEVYECTLLDAAHLSRSPGCPIVLNFMANLVSRRLAEERKNRQLIGELDVGNINDRVASFRQYPSRERYNISRVVESGFSWTGRRERLECFSCRTTPQIPIINEKSHPDILHIQMSPDCDYILAKCGAAYVDKILEETDAGLNPGRAVNVELATAEAAAPPEPDEGLSAARCKMCLDDVIGTMYSACGHSAACIGCAEKLEECPICRTIIGNKIFLTNL